MKKALYFSDLDIDLKNGIGLVLRSHYKMLQEIYGDNILKVIIANKKTANKDTYYLNPSKQSEKVVSVLKGYAPLISKKNVDFLCDLVKRNNVEVVFIENSMQGHLIKAIKRKAPNVKVVAFFTDIEADLLKQEMQTASIKRKIICRLLIRNEKETVKYADKYFVLNLRDKQKLNEYYDAVPDEVIPIIIPDNSTKLNNEKKHYKGEKLEALFVGGDFWPNVKGIKCFIQEVMPKIEKNLNLKIVGLDMEKHKREFESLSPNVEVIGTVKDLKPYYESTHIIIAPIRNGGGMKVKTAEALSYGKTFLGLEESLVGYWEAVPEALKNNGIYLCKDADGFINNINKLYADEFVICRADIEEFIYQLCSYSVNLDRFKKLFKF